MNIADFVEIFFDFRLHSSFFFFYKKKSVYTVYTVYCKQLPESRKPIEGGASHKENIHDTFKPHSHNSSVHL